MGMPAEPSQRGQTISSNSISGFIFAIEIPLNPPEDVKKSILKEGERGYWAACREAACQRMNETLPKVLDLPARSRFGEGRAIPFYRQLVTMKNLNHSRSLVEPCDLLLSKHAILKL
jgi:hypothetical protein